MANSQHVKINLIGKNREESVTQDILRWAVSIGRVIVVVTELIALGALVYRFNIDNKIVDLHDQIKTEHLFVEGQASKEKDYRSIQARLSNIKSINKQTQAKISIMNGILQSITKGDFSSTNLSVNENNIGINGTAFSIFPINNFIQSLKKNPNVISISLDNISSTTEGIQFKVNIELKPDINI